MHKKFIVVLFPVLIWSCGKEAGPGGNSSLTGKILGYDHSSGEAEVTQITCSPGTLIDDDDYFLINVPGQGTYYYVWYDNTNWVGGDPALTGRTGIKVTYQYNDANTVIASNTAAAIQTIAGADYTVTVVNDIITLTCRNKGETPDAKNVNSPMDIDISNQGKNTGLTALIPIADERVYLVYGDNDFYGQDVHTDESGYFRFNGLCKGKYKVYAFSKDTTSANGTMLEVSTEAEITHRKEIVAADNLIIVK